MDSTETTTGQDAAPRRDLESARADLTAWLATKHAAARSVALERFTIPSGNGGSNETLLSTMRWEDDAGTHEQGIVVRVEPPKEGALFFESDFGLQREVITALHTEGSVPIPAILFSSDEPDVFGAPFWIMERVRGSVPSDWPSHNAAGFLADATPEQRHDAWASALDALIAIHRVAAVTTWPALLKPDRGATGLDQQIWWWRHMFELATPPGGVPAATLALQASLFEHVPDDRPTELSWGDARIGNMIFSDFRCRAVLDWEMVSLGGALEDLGWWLFLDRWSSECFGVARLEGLGTREETIARWEAGTGRRATDIDWYERFGAYRMQAIMMRGAQRSGVPEMAASNPVLGLIERMDL